MKVHELIAHLQTLNQDANVKYADKDLGGNVYYRYVWKEMTSENIEIGFEGDVYEEGDLIERGEGDAHIVIGVPVI